MQSDLGRASFWQRIATLFQPGRLEAAMQISTLADGTVQVDPVFKVNGKRVPPSAIGNSPDQYIFGHKVRLSPQVLELLGSPQGKPHRLSKNKAAISLTKWRERGIQANFAGFETPASVYSAQLELTVDLNPDDTLKISTEYLDNSGVILPKPKHLSPDEWIEVDGSVFTLPECPPELQKFVAEDPITLAGDDVPRTLKALENAGPGLIVNQNSLAEKLAVFDPKFTPVLRIDGDNEQLSIRTSLSFSAKKDLTHEETIDSVSEFLSVQPKNRQRKFKRVGDGWVELTPSVLSDAEETKKKLTSRLGNLNEIRGTDIPEVLKQVSELGEAWSSYVSPRVKKAHNLLETEAKATFHLGVVSHGGTNWLQLSPTYNHARFELPHSEVSGEIKSGGRWIRRDRTWVRIDARKHADVSSEITRQRLEPGSEGFLFEAMRKEEVLGAFRPLGTIREDDSYRSFHKQLMDFQQIETVPVPAGVRATLFDHQQHGLNWLGFLQSYGLNGILADDMGLGKTLQALVALRHSIEKYPERSWFPSLVVCPASLVENWQSEALKYIPALNVIKYIGVNRLNQLNAATESHADLIVTTFTTAANDIERLAAIRWRYVIIDEAHQVKNPQAQRSKALRLLPARHRLAITGTPIQNSPAELWALFDLLMPGYLKTATAFKQDYAGLWTKSGADFQGSAGALRSRTSPFILRRMKTEVAKDLPPKQVIDRLVDLSPRQVGLYKNLVEGQESRELTRKIKSDDYSRSSIQILALLTKLRLICNHPAIEDGGTIECAASGKLQHLSELLEEVRDGEHRALIFSQSTRTLDIIQEHLGRCGDNFLRLDGSTTVESRLPMVKRFNNDNTILCFLISTKAGGVGLNLTGADTVIMYDHDWNPANDLQAMDRAHRKGQTKPVTIYRLISKGTLEEKILERQSSKIQLADAVVGIDSDGFKSLTRDELLSLFTYSP